MHTWCCLLQLMLIHHGFTWKTYKSSACWWKSIICWSIRPNILYMRNWKPTIKKSEYTKKNDVEQFFKLWILIDDFADHPSFTRQAKRLHTLYLRGRHNMISTITTIQQHWCNKKANKSTRNKTYMYINSEQSLIETHILMNLPQSLHRKPY